MVIVGAEELEGRAKRDGTLELIVLKDWANDGRGSEQNVCVGIERVGGGRRRARGGRRASGASSRAELRK